VLVPGQVENLTHTLQDAELAAYANTQVTAGQTSTNVPAQAAQPATGTTSVADAGAMDVDEQATTQETAGEGHGGVKRKAGEDAESSSKKLRMGMSMTSFQLLVADTTIARRTHRCCFKEVKLTDVPLILRLLTDDCRDRENCTVFVSDLPEGATEDDLKALFKDVRPLPHLVWKPY
jgi:hypothetical protein